MNRLTGTASYYRAIESENTVRSLPTVPPSPSVIPAGELEKVTRRAGPTWRGLFQGELYNVSSWHITLVTIGIELKAPTKNGRTMWNRAYRVAVSIPPLSVGSISFRILGADELLKAGEDRWGWTILGGKGFPSSE